MAPGVLALVDGAELYNGMPVPRQLRVPGIPSEVFTFLHSDLARAQLEIQAKARGGE